MDRKQFLVDCFNEYTGKNNEVLEKLYDKNVVFEDPLTRVEGFDQLVKYYEHAYSSVKQIHFHFKEIHESGSTLTCEWDMDLVIPVLSWGKKYTVRGASVITFSEESEKVIKHHDYLDIGSMVYERIPVFGRLIHQLKSRLS